MDDKEKKIVSRLATVIVLLVVVIVTLLIIILILLRNNGPGVCGTADKPVQYCGTICGNVPVLDSGMTMESFNKGKTLFKIHCAVCHTMTDQRLTGPGLRDVAGRIPNTKGWLEGYVLNADSMRKSGEPYSCILYREYDSLYMTSFTGTLTKKDVNDLICYMKASRY
jgi:cytochrome c2